MSFTSNLEWRYATKKFDLNKKVSTIDLEKVLEAIRLAPTSYGLQAFHLHVIENTPKNLETLRKLKSASWEQAQIDSCSHLLVFSARTDFAKSIDEYFTLLSGANQEARERLSAYEDLVMGSLPRMNVEWSKKQTYLALGFALAAAAELQIDSCPMEGFDHEKFHEILGLPENLVVSAIMPLGYRAEDEKVRTKTRFKKEDLITMI
ncbi:MAG: nitroreductase family protein [Candidatus Falkowbacteria bacterium]|nr:nitroreductase family protein [Candidatus Falkowbacteria bacterium]